MWLNEVLRIASELTGQKVWGPSGRRGAAKAQPVYSLRVVRLHHGGILDTSNNNTGQLLNFLPDQFKYTRNVLSVSIVMWYWTL